MNQIDNKQSKHLVYHISDEYDIIHHFSPVGFELLSQSFLDYMDLTCPETDDTSPIILEITGRDLNEKQQNAIDHAIWLHYRLRMTWIARSLRACRIKTFWFFICTILSSVFLYMVTNHTSEVATEIFYLPIWFFGYRLLTFPLQEYLPRSRQLNHYRRLAAMTLIFSEKPMERITESLINSARTENAFYYEKAMEGIEDEVLTKNFTRKDGTLILSCQAASLEELLNPCSVSGNPLISEELASFLEQAEHFVDPDKAVIFSITGNNLDLDEQKILSSALIDYFQLRYRKAKIALTDNRRDIISYALGLIVSAIALYLFGRTVEIAMHEFLIITLWFFGDYLVEFILCSQSDAKYILKQCRQLMNLNLSFEK